MSSPSFPSSRVQLLGSNPSLVEVQGQEKAAGPETLPHLWSEKNVFAQEITYFLYMFHQWDRIVQQFTHQTCRIVKPTSYIFSESSKNMHVIEKYKVSSRLPLFQATGMCFPWPAFQRSRSSNLRSLESSWCAWQCQPQLRTMANLSSRWI